jgi:integrase
MTKSEAKRKLRAWLESEGVNSANLRAVQSGKTFAEQAHWWEENKLALRSLSYQESREINLRKHLVPYFGKTAASLVTEQQAQEFITHLTGRKLERATIESIVGTLKAVLGEKIWRDWNLVLPKASDAEQRYFTRDEMLRIVGAAQGKWKPFFALLAETGLRFGEGAGLHVEDLDLPGCKVYVRRSIYKGVEVPTKTRAGVRAVDITPEVAGMLKEHLAGRTSGRVFETRNHTALGKDNTRRMLHSILTDLKIAKGGLHSFRHGRVSVLQANGVPADLVKEWVGHSNLRTTSRYTHFDDSYRQSVAQKVGIFAKEPANVETKLRFGPNGPNFPLPQVRNDSLHVATA